RQTPDRPPSPRMSAAIPGGHTREQPCPGPKSSATPTASTPTATSSRATASPTPISSSAPAASANAASRKSWPRRSCASRPPHPRAEGRQTLDACDHCASCHLVDAGTHPDLFAVSRPEDKNEMPIEVLKELCRNFSLKSARGHGKIGILDDADDLNDESANC